MSLHIKCSECHTWNEAKDYCQNCGHLLNLDLQREQDRQKLHQEEQARPITRFYNYLNSLKRSDSPIDKVKFRLLNSAWLLFLLLVTALIALVALAPG